MRRSLLFFGLRIGSTALATVWSFLLTYTLVRQIGLQDYAFLAAVIAFASLVLQVDLGISVRLFGRMRQNFVDPTKGDAADLRSAAVTALIGYSCAAILATLIFTLVLEIWHLGPVGHSLAIILFFGGSVLPLPWMVLRIAANANDQYVITEAIDCGRRALLLLLTGGLAYGLPLLDYTIGFLLLWVCALLLLARLAQHRFGLFTGASIRRGWQVLREDGREIAGAANLSLSDFLIYIFPYYALLAAKAGATALIAFDMFYKVTRFGGTAFFTVTETMLPHQTRAFHANDTRNLTRYIGLAFLLCAAPCLVASTLIYVWGDMIFGTLLGHPDIVSPHMQLAICFMLVFMMLKAVSGTVLAGIGRLRPLAHRATTVLVAMLTFALISGLAGWSIDVFVTGYVLLYAGQAISYFLLMLQMVRGLRLADPAAQPA
jgi:O-antigen/teichoic acid export membrane protein